MSSRLEHCFWIGGGSRAGKSSVARRIADEHGLQLYETDLAMADHAGRSSPAEHPLLTEFRAMDMDERWLQRSPQIMLESFPWFRGECFEMIIDDLLAMPSDLPVVVEGFRLLPDLVSPHLAGRSRAVWLLPTPRFRQSVVEQFGGWEFLSKTNDPEKSRENLYERDRLFTEKLSEDVRRLGLSAIEVDTGMSQDSVYDQATRLLSV